MQNQNHLGGCLNPDPVLIVPDVWEKLLETYKPESVIDVGCGYGHAVRWFNDRMNWCDGIEGWADAIKNGVSPLDCCRWDFATGPLTPQTCKRDLCWCCEFVEHVEARYIPNFLETFKQCKVVAMTHATPGQGGFHHVNEQPAEYWIGVMAAIGYSLDKANTERIRRPAPYGVNNLLIFTKNA